MQMTGGATTPGNKSPPPPMVQQAVGGDSAGHSRNVSQGSAKSQQHPPLPQVVKADHPTVQAVAEGVVAETAAAPASDNAEQQKKAPAINTSIPVQVTPQPEETAVVLPVAAVVSGGEEKPVAV